MNLKGSGHSIFTGECLAKAPKILSNTEAVDLNAGKIILNVIYI